MRTYQIASKADGERLAEALVRATKLDAPVVEKMLAFGAVQLRFRGKGPWERVRDGRLKLHPQDQVRTAYDPKVLAFKAFDNAQSVYENKNYGVWIKPAGVMSQGTDAGDHVSLLYAIEKTGKKPFPVHRLDRETEGLTVVAYTPKAAAALSQLFQEYRIQKTYWAIVTGELANLNEQGLIDHDLDGKSAQTRYRILKRLPENRLLMEAAPLTGRLHQIRRHFDLLECPVLGDPKYGRGNKNRDGMKLAAVGLVFMDPIEKVQREWSYEPEWAALN